MAETKLRDPVHNFIRFDAGEMKLINLDVIQRLRGIRQLAMASLVYPGALHTRFDHTLGVAHVAGQMAHELGIEGDERDLVRRAALLHDIGHGPFSHVSESALERFANRAAIPSHLKKEKIHELITAHLIRGRASISRCIGADRCNEVAQLLATGHGDPVLKSIVSGPLDADKQDYLLRDSLFAGVNYGVFDIRQLQRSLVAQTLSGQRELLIKEDGVHAVEQFVMAKYYLTTMVYRHKVRLISDQMIFRAIVLGIEKDAIATMAKLYRFEVSEDFVSNYLTWNDSRFLYEFGEIGDSGKKSTQLVKRLLGRNLLKRIFRASAKLFPPDCREKLLAIGKLENLKTRNEIESEIARLVSAATGVPIDPDFTIFHAYQTKSVRESSRNDEAAILVAKESLPGKFEEESVLFSSINEKLAEEFVEAYVPIESLDSSQRSRFQLSLFAPITELITEKTRSLQLTLDL